MKKPDFVSASLRLCGSKAPLLTKEGWQRLPLTGWFFLTILVLSSVAFAQNVPAPKDILSFTPGDDRKLARWSSIVDYFKKLDAASDRMIFEEIGKSTMGAPFVYATISTPENLKNLEKYKQINAKLADPRTFKSNDKQAQKLIKDGKTIVLITCGIHSTEVGSTLSSTVIAHRLTSSNEPEIQKILENTIILLVPSLNPDGVDIVKNWYDKTLGTPYEGTDPPELYHKYVGHDNNRDWYAFTQVETQLTVDKIHNVWHPQIVHDIHQQGENGARLFLPPYMQPVEPNVPKQIVEGYTELGNAMAADLRKRGLEGITTGTTYDAWTPARAYSHYHGGVRILSETASAKLATPITVKFEDLRGASGGLDAKKESPNFGPVWKGGEWKLRNITDYMTSAVFSLMNHAADNRERWLARFYEIGKEAVRPRKDGELKAYILPPTKTPEETVKRLSLYAMLNRGGVVGGFADPKDIKSATLRNYLGLVIPGVAKRKERNEMALVIPMDQPYGVFAKALLENQVYPNLIDDKGTPTQPYDVTAHTMSLLLDTPAIPIHDSVTNFFASPKKSSIDIAKFNLNSNGFGLYKSHNASMDEGWTRWVFERENVWEVKPRVTSLKNHDIRSDGLESKYRTIIFPDQSPNQILNGYAKGSMPDEYTGGVGRTGVENLRKFVEAGGTLVFLNRASNFAIEQFNLPVRDVTRGLARKDFFIPGSILRTELDTTHPIAKGMPAQSIAWFENSPAFEIINAAAQAEPPASAGGRDSSIRNADDESGRNANPLLINNLDSAPGAASPAYAGGSDKIRIIARYPSDPSKILLSGWALGAEKIAGKAALVEFTIGRGKIVLFGFRPQYRGQSLATFPLLFNAIQN